MRILIPNATGPTNTGDQAILKGLLMVIEKTYPSYDLIIHSSVPHKYGSLGHTIKPNLYFWSVFEKPNTVTRVYRMLQLIAQYILHMLHIRFPLGSRRLLELLEDYHRADLIIFVGGGYFSTHPTMTQSLNLIMVLSHFAFARLCKAKAVVAPMSFGPMAKKWQEKLTAKILRNFDLVSVREEISYNKLKQHRVKNLILSADQALFIDAVVPGEHSTRKFTLGFTIRNWKNEEETQKNITILTEVLERFAKENNVVIQPIIQVSSVEYGDRDLIITENIAKELTQNGITVNKTIILNNLEKAIDTYSKLDLIIGMRMHSNIIAATQLKPFVAIAYEYKTRGIAKMLDLEEYCLDYSKFEMQDLLSTVEKAYKNREEITNKLKRNLAKIKENEFGRWEKILREFSNKN